MLRAGNPAVGEYLQQTQLPSLASPAPPPIPLAASPLPHAPTHAQCCCNHKSLLGTGNEAPMAQTPGTTKRYTSLMEGAEGQKSTRPC